MSSVMFGLAVAPKTSCVLMPLPGMLSGDQLPALFQLPLALPVHVWAPAGRAVARTASAVVRIGVRRMAGPPGRIRHCTNGASGEPALQDQLTALAEQLGVGLL